MYTQEQLEMIARDRAAEEANVDSRRLIAPNSFFKNLGISQYGDEWRNMSQGEQEDLIRAYQVQMRNEAESNIAASYSRGY